ncbi:MAG TPA: AMP-binding protein [Acidimicrobiales bacterium]|nr:AMP-binding protein [Acidimicrobiales bacterium]
MRLAPTHHAVLGDLYGRPGGPWDVPTLDALLSDAPPARGAAVVDARERLAPDEVAARVDRLAGGLRRAGVGRGDVVAWQLPNCADAVILSRACWRLGAVAAPLHHRAGGSELDAMVELLAPAVAVSAPDLPLASMPGAVRTGHDDARWDDLRSGPPCTERAATGEDLALVQFTSGSTGVPKAVLQTHRALACKTVQMLAAHGLGPGDAALMPAPLAHVSGMLNGILVPGAGGMRSVLMERWDPERGLGLVEGESVTFMVGPPAIFLGLLEAPGYSPAAVASLRVVSSGATGITPEFVESAGRGLGAFVKRSYGCTEAPTVTTCPEGEPRSRAATTDGRPLGATEVRIVDPDTGGERRAGAEGEVWVRGPELFAGYAVADQTAAAVHDGWLRTGDLGRLDDDGWLTIVGRRKDLIIRGGENVVPAEVERVLERHPAVRQAVVVGVPDRRLGERVAAFVVADAELDAPACRRWFTAQGVAGFKAPERVAQVAELPVLSLGKPDRALLRQRARELFT